MNYEIKQIVSQAEESYSYKVISENFQAYDEFTKELVRLTARRCIHLAFLNPQLDSLQVSRIMAREFDIPMDEYDHSEYYFDTTRNR